MIKIFSFLLDLLKKPIELSGASYEQVKEIALMKLKSDFRRPRNFGNGSKKFTMLASILLNLLFGAVFALMIIAVPDTILGITLLFSFVLMMLLSSFLLEFTTILFDTRDNQILLHRPITTRTLLVSRLIHIGAYMSINALSIGLPGILTIAIAYSIPAGLLFILGLFMTTIFALFCSIVGFLLIIKYLSAERFKDILSYVQMGMSFFFIIGFQLIGRITDSLKTHEGWTEAWWCYLFQPVWNANLTGMGIDSVQPNVQWGQAAIAILIPSICLIFTIRFLTKGYNTILQKMAEPDIIKKSKQQYKKGTSLLQRIFCRSNYEIAAWDITRLMVKRDRMFKQSLYPIIAFAIVFVFIQMKPDFTNLSEWFANQANTKNYYGFIFMGVYIGLVFTLTAYSEKFQASWIYAVTPIKAKGEIISGAFKMMLARIYIPTYILFTTIAVLVWGIRLIPIMLFSACFLLILFQILIVTTEKHLPFSQPIDNNRRGTKMVYVLFLLIITGVMVGIIYLLSFIGPIVFWILAAIFIAISVLLFRYMRQMEVSTSAA